MKTKYSSDQFVVDYQRLFNALPGSYIAFYPDAPAFTIAAQNKSHAQISMVKTKDVINKPVLEAYPDTSEKYRKTGVSEIIELLTKVLKSGKEDVATLRYDIKTVKGEYETRYWRVTHFPIFDSHKQVALVCQVTADVTAEINAAAQLKLTQQQLNEALSVGMVGTWMWDVPGNVVIGDSSMASMFNVSAAEAAAGLPLKAFTDAIYPDDRQRVQNEIAKAVSKGNAFRSEYRTASTTGKVRWLLARGRIERDTQGKPERFPGVLVDITERKRLEEELRQANERLEHRVELRTAELETSNTSLARSNQELQNFAYVASHDLQEPLRKIQAFGNLLETEYSRELGDGQDYLKRMRSAAARMSALIEDILAFSRITTRGRDFTRVNLRTVAQEVLGDLELRISDTSAKVSIGKLPTIEASVMPSRSKVKPDMCVLTVSDNGLGFDEKYADRIFAVFQRLHTRDTYEGTGIGLAVCRRIAERHGGSISARSKLGAGSTFTITLPIKHLKGEHLL